MIEICVTTIFLHFINNMHILILEKCCFGHFVKEVVLLSSSKNTDMKLKPK